MNYFLLELGTEELPPKLLHNLSIQLAQQLRQSLLDNNIAFNKIKQFSTPRRLAVLIDGLPDKQPAKNISKKGPNTQASSQAINGFMQSVGVKNADELVIKTIAKKDFFFYEFTKDSSPIISVLTILIPQAIMNITAPRTMRWANHHSSFIRPIRWLVALLNEQIIPTHIFGVQSTNITYGLRFAEHNHLNLSHAQDYQSALSTLHITAEFEQRKQLIKTQVNTLATQHKLKANIPNALLNEVSALVEAPQAFLGRFPPKFFAPT